MDPFNYIKLIEFHYILEGFKTLFKNETDRGPKGTMFRTAEQIYHEIFHSCVRTVVREETKFKLTKKWREVQMERIALDINVFNDVHAEINTSLDDYITQKFIEEKFAARWLKEKRDFELAAVSAASAPSPASSGILSCNNSNGNNLVVSSSSLTNGARLPSCYATTSNEQRAKGLMSNRNYQSMVSLDSGFQSDGQKTCHLIPVDVPRQEKAKKKELIRLDKLKDTKSFRFESNNKDDACRSSRRSQASNNGPEDKSKSDKVEEKFASLPKEFLTEMERRSKDKSEHNNILEKHINKTFSYEHGIFGSGPERRSTSSSSQSLFPINRDTLPPPSSNHDPALLPTVSRTIKMLPSNPDLSNPMVKEALEGLVKLKTADRQNRRPKADIA